MPRPETPHPHHRSRCTPGSILWVSVILVTVRWLQTMRSHRLFFTPKSVCGCSICIWSILYLECSGSSVSQKEQSLAFLYNLRNFDWNMTEIRRNRVEIVQVLTLGFLDLGSIAQFFSFRCVDYELWRNHAHWLVNDRRLGLGCLNGELCTKFLSSLLSGGFIVWGIRVKVRHVTG